MKEQTLHRAAPVVNDRIGPAILNPGTYQDEYLLAVNKVFSIISFPDPNILASRKKATDATIKAHTLYIKYADT